MKNKLDLYFYHLLFKPTPHHNQNGTQLSKKKKNVAIIFFRKIFVLFKTIFSLLKIPFYKKNKVLFFNHSQRTRKNSDYTKTPLYLNENIFKKDNFYFVDNNQTISPPYQSPISILNISHINELFSILSTFLKIFIKFKKNTFSEYDFNFWLQTKYWFFILKTLKPKKILFVVWYAYQPVIAAAKNLSIPTIDLQHGAIHNGHDFYYIKNIDEYILKKSTLPDACWVYGEYWKEKLIAAGWGKKNIKVFGYYLNSESKNIENNTPYILYTTSISANKIEVLNHIISISEEIKKHNLKIIISPHPNEDPNDYKDILSDGIMLSDKDSYELLKNCQVHIGFFSTLLWEGVYFRKSTYILNFHKYKSDYPYLNDLVDNNLARSINIGEFPSVFNLSSDINIDKYFSKTIYENLIFS